MTGSSERVGFIGQGFIGKNYADDFEARGFTVTRYALEEPYRANKAAIAHCSIVFIAVPTPTTPVGFDGSIVRGAVACTVAGAIVVIKSTLVPGTTEEIQAAYPDRLILFSPEFLREKTAAHDAAHPERTLIGIPADTPEHRAAAQRVLAVLPRAPFERVCKAREAECVKLANNAFLTMKVVFANLMHDAVTALGGDWDAVRDALGADLRIGPSHLSVLHESGHPGAKPGRGAGGHCFIKDFAALRFAYETLLPDDAEGRALLRGIEEKNVRLLTESGKDLDLLRGVYGETFDHPHVTSPSAIGRSGELSR